MTSGKMTSGEMKAATVIYLFTCAVTSSSLNGIVIYVFTKIGLKKLNCKDALVFSTSIGDFIQSLLGYSLEIYATVSTKNQAVKTGNSFCKIRNCGIQLYFRLLFQVSAVGHLIFVPGYQTKTVSKRASAFIITFLALSSTAHMTALAYDRYLTICKPFMANRIHGSYILCTAFISSCWIYGFVWAAFPLIGWSGFELESDALRCSIDWASKKTKDRLYIIFLFIFCFIIPVSVMCYSFYRVKQELREMQSRASSLFGRESKAAKDNVRAEKRHTRLATVMCMVFIITWFPYTLLSFWASFFTHIAKFPIILATISAAIAKSSTLSTPIVYIAMHRRFRRRVLETPFFKAFCCQCSLLRWCRKHSLQNLHQESWV